MNLTYKELQSALRTAKKNGLSSIKLNSKQTVLQEEYDRITNNSNYPFNKNTVKVENNTPQVFNSANSYVLPAMNSSRAPSWLCKPVTVYVVDGIDYLPYELDMALTGAVCDLTCELPAVTVDREHATVASKTNERKLQANQPPRLQQPARKDVVSKARPAMPIVNSAKDLPKVAVTFKAQEEYSPYFIDTTKVARYTTGLGTTERQAARNLQDAISATKQGLKNVISIAKGLHKANVERALKVAA